MAKRNCFLDIFGIKCFCLIALLLCSCTPKLDFGDIDFEPQIVVEGWIENNSRANVLLTQWLPLYSEGKDVPAMDIPIKWAKVTLSDGEREEVLVGRVDRDYLSAFVYTSSVIKGEYGKRYYLKVEYSGKTVTAETYIPEHVEIDNFMVGKCEDDLYNISVTFRDNPERDDYYKFFSKVLSDNKRYLPSFMGTISDKGYKNSVIDIEVNRGFKIGKTDNDVKYTPYYELDDTVMIKLTRLPEDAYLFWSDYENEIMNGKNPLFPSTTNLKSNINGGKGIWAGYAKDERMVIIKKHVSNFKNE